MPENKLNYFMVVEKVIVKAKSQHDAEKIASGGKNLVGEILIRSTDIKRIPSVQAQKLVNKLNA